MRTGRAAAVVLLLAGLVLVAAGSVASRRPNAPAPAATVAVRPPPGPIDVLGLGGPAPIFPADVPDPFVLRLGSLYYMYSTQPWNESTNVPLRVSTDLVHWESLGDAMPTVPAWATAGRTWAPSVLARPGRYVMYYSSEHYYSSRQCIGTATSATPTGPFIPRRDILECQFGDGGSIDPQVFVDVTGTAYLYWKSDDNALHRPSTLWAQRLSPDGLHLVGRPVQMLHDDQDWERYTIEAPAMVREAGHYWLFYSGSWLGSPDYAIGYAVCAGPLGPCTKASTTGPWYRSGPLRSGPGEESFFRDAGGNVWIAYDAWMPGEIAYRNGFVRAPRIERVWFHPNSPPVVSPPAVGGAANPHGGYYVLQADGTVVALGGAPYFGSTKLPGGLARSIAVMPDGRGYVVLDAYGGVHRIGSARSLPASPQISWPGWDIARGIAITPSGRGFAVVDGYGGVHPVGDAPAAAGPFWPQVDMARAVTITPTGHGYAVLGSDGSLVAVGDAPAPVGMAPLPLTDRAVAFALSPDGRGYAVLDEVGVIRTSGDAPAAPYPNVMQPTWVGLGLLPGGHYAAVRDDSYSYVTP